MPAMTPRPLEQFQQEAEEAEAFLASPGQLRGKEKREMEKKLRRARIASRLLENYVSPNKKQVSSDENTDISTETGSYFWRIRSMAAGISDRELPFWTFAVCDDLGVDPMMRRHLSDQFLIVQAINAMAKKIQDEWFAYKKRKMVNGNEPKFDFSLSAACLDPRRFTWTAGMEAPDLTSLQEAEEENEKEVQESIPEEEAVEDPSAAVDMADTGVQVVVNDVVLKRLSSKSSTTSASSSRLREGNYMSKTKAALQRETETSKSSRDLRKQTIGEKESWRLQAKNRMGSFKDKKTT